ncbi:formin-like protein 18 isoform X2 [Spinacia oleracea]|uniref:Formin-like protein n=1 Tax=Spinacia oleracea TaxID=3562 RepID=A0A9R0HUN1_SPIOL|nr:formin-like protein 18 isoform X2 [Spinacia oleracea]
MSILRRLFHRKPPDGLLEISERIYVFDCCFTTHSWGEKSYRGYLAGIVSQLQDQFPDAALLVFNFRKAELVETSISRIMSEYDITVMDYPRHYQGCPILSMELIHHFLRSTESWLALGPHNILLLHCETGGWPLLAFMLAALLLYKKQYTGEQKTLDMVYKQAPRQLLPIFSPLNPIPSQLRYLQYVSRRNVASQWPPLDRPLTLDCIIFRRIPDFNGEGGCCPSFRIYGQDPLNAEDRTPKLLFSTQQKSKAIRLYKQAESELVKIDINCNIQGDVVLECTSLHRDMEHEDMMFRIMFNTAFIRSNILMLNRDEIDTPWDTRDQFPKDFRAEVLLSDMDASASIIAANLSCFEEMEGLPMEAFAKVQELFSNVDWLESRADISQSVIQKVLASHSSPECFGFATVPDAATTGPKKSKEEQKYYNFCNSEDKDDQEFLCQRVSKVCNLGQHSHGLNNFQTLQLGYQPREIAQTEFCSEAKMLSTTPCVPRKKDFRSPDDVKGGIIASRVSETTPSLVPVRAVPLLFSNNASLSFPMQFPQQSHVAESEKDLFQECAYPGPEDASRPSTITQSSLTALGSKVPTFRGGRGPPPVIQPSIDYIHEDSSVMDKCRPEFSSPPETSLRKDCFEILTSSLPSPPRSRVNPSRLESTLKYPSRPEPPPPPPPPPPPLAAATGTAPLHPPTPSLNEKSAIDAEVYLPPLPNVSPQTSVKLAEFGPLSSQPPPYKDSAAKSLHSPPAPPLKEDNGKSGPTPALLLPQKSGSSRSFPAPLSPPPSPPPPPPPPPLQYQQPQVSSSVPCPPPPPVGLNKTSSKMGTNPAPATPLSSVNGKGRSMSRSLGPKSSQTRKLKPLHWLKLNRAVQGSLWAESPKAGETSIAPEIDMSELENLFSASVPNSDQGTTGGKSRRLGAPISDIVQLIDHRRAYNCEIILSKVKVPLKELMASVLSLEDSSLDIDQVENLIKCCPTKEDMELLKGYRGEVGKLGKCEQFFLELMQVPRVEAKLRVFSFKMQFRTQVSELRKSLNIVNSTADQIRSSVKLKRIMQTILSLGNALNQGTARGSAVGFRLDSLLKLTETRARNNKMTLMHYLCKVISEKLPEVLDFSKDFASIEPATKIQLNFLAEEMQAVNKGLEKVVQELSMSENDGPISDAFRKNLKEFLCFAEAEGRNIDALIVYFGEDPARCPFEQVVMTLLNFTRMFNQAQEENCKQHGVGKKN